VRFDGHGLPSSHPDLQVLIFPVAVGHDVADLQVAGGTAAALMLLIFQSEVVKKIKVLLR
jgi:hypothetical protein